MSLLNVGAAGTSAETAVVVSGVATASTSEKRKSAGTTNRRIANLQKCFRDVDPIMPQGFIAAASNVTM
jgi:hypothetical protein